MPKPFHTPARLAEWLQLCVANPELVREYDRLRGTCLAKARSPIEQMIDESTGSYEAAAKAFFDFCTDLFFRIAPPA